MHFPVPVYVQQCLAMCVDIGIPLWEGTLKAQMSVFILSLYRLNSDERKVLLSFLKVSTNL